MTSSGVRLYDPIEGGRANDYDYVSGDPMNRFDLDGRKMKTDPDEYCLLPNTIFVGDSGRQVVMDLPHPWRR